MREVWKPAAVPGKMAGVLNVHSAGLVLERRLFELLEATLRGLVGGRLLGLIVIRSKILRGRIDRRATGCAGSTGWMPGVEDGLVQGFRAGCAFVAWKCIQLANTGWDHADWMAGSLNFFLSFTVGSSKVLGWPRTRSLRLGLQLLPCKALSRWKYAVPTADLCVWEALEVSSELLVCWLAEEWHLPKLTCRLF